MDEEINKKIRELCEKYLVNWSEDRKKDFFSCLDAQETEEDLEKFLGMYDKVLPKADILQFLKDISKPLIDRELPEITQPGMGKLISPFAIQIATIIKDKNILFYRINTRNIVEVGKVKLEKDDQDNYRGFVEVKPNRFITLIEKFVRPGYYVWNDSKKKTEFKEKSIGSDLANTLLCSDILQRSLPQIERIYTIPLPIMYKGELTFPKRGYDERFHSWLSYDAPDISNLNMPLEDAKILLDNLFKEFCFKSKDDKHMAIAALLTPFLRGLFKSFTVRTPIFCYIANRERCGKDYCAGITGIVYEGVALEESPISSSENAKSNNTEELRKKILSAMIMGRKRLHFSNNKGYINNATIEAVATAEKWSDRLLGKNEILNFDNEIDFSLSGNVGIGFTADFANRCRFINFFLDIEDANSRKFNNPNLHGWLKENRSLILSALFSLVKNWINKGKPEGCEPFASYHEWAETCGGIMESAGYENPCKPEKQSLVIGGDYETIEMKKLFEYCYNKKPEMKLTKSEIKNLIRSEPDTDIFSRFDFDVMSDSVKFGLILTKFGGRILSDIKMEVVDNSVRTARQEIIFTKELFGRGGNLGEDLPSCGLTEDNNIEGVMGKTLPTLHTLPENSPKNDQNIEIIKIPGQEEEHLELEK